MNKKTSLLTLLIIIAAVSLRSLIMVFAGYTHFDSDEAVFGLMAKHISEGSAFPVFYYGQRYLLAVSSYLAAPLFWLFGPSIWALRFPELIVSFIVPYLIVRTAVRELRIPWYLALLAVSFFLLPSPELSRKLMEVACANPETYLVVILVWMWRERPVWMGTVLGFGVLHREFAAYSAGGIVLVDWLKGDSVKTIARRYWKAFALTAAIIAAVKFLGLFASNSYGIGTPLNAKLFLSRLWDGPYWIVTNHLYRFLGLTGLILLPVLARTVWLVAKRPSFRSALRENAFCFYLILVSLISCVAYTVGSTPIQDDGHFRYNMLLIFFPIGTSLLFFALEKNRRALQTGAALIGLWTAINFAAQIQTLTDFFRNPPTDKDQVLIEALQKDGITWGSAPYWTCYRISFRSNEAIRLYPSSGNPRIEEYKKASDAERAKAVKIEEQPCELGRKIADWCVTP